MDFTTSRTHRLELNNSGAWKLLLKFDPTDAAAISVLDLAGKFAQAVTELSKSGAAHFSLRVSTDETYPQVTMRWLPGQGWCATDKT